MGNTAPVSLNAPLDAQQAALDRRRKLAALLQQQGATPIEQPQQPGVKISPLQGINKLVQAVMGSYQQDKLDKEQSALSAALQAQREGNAQGVANTVMQPSSIPGETLPGMPSTVIPGLVGPSSTILAHPDKVDAARSALAKLLSSSDPNQMELGKILMEKTMGANQSRETQQAEMARALLGENRQDQRQKSTQDFQGEQGGLNRVNAAAMNTQDNQTRSDIAALKPPPQPKNPVSATITKLGKDGKPHIFRQDGDTGAFSIDEGIAYEKPPSETGSKTADSTSYKFHVTEIDKRAKPLDDAATRFSRLQDTINQGTAQADALVAPELMTVMAGGLGSGLRINEAEINRVQGGRPMIAQLQAKVRSWLGGTQKEAINYGHEERKAIQDLLGIVGSKLQAKQGALTDASRIISGDSTTDSQRRKALAELDEKLRGIDSGKNDNQGVPSVGGSFNGQKVLKVEKVN